MPGQITISDNGVFFHSRADVEARFLQRMRFKLAPFDRLCKDFNTVEKIDPEEHVDIRLRR
jgi:hypothetical protein